MQPVALECGVLHEALHVEHFHQTVGNRRAGRAGNGSLLAIGFKHPLQLDEQVKSLVRAGRVAHAGHALHGGVVKQVLELVQLVNAEGIYTQLVKRHHLVALTHRLQAGFHARV